MKWMGRLSWVLGGLLAGFGCTSAPPTAASPTPAAATRENYASINAFVQEMKILQAKYVDAKAVSSPQLWHHAMSGMASSLDPYSDYEPPAEFRRRQSQRTGEFVGVGIDLFKVRGKLPMISRVWPQSPAAAGGVKPGDAIVQIDGRQTLHINVARCARLIQGAPGSTVKLQLLRRQKPLTVTLVRRKLIQPSIRPEAVKLVKPSIGYIRIDRFSLHTATEFAAALDNLKKQGAQALILDLRHNLGGVVRTAQEVASLLLPENTVIFVTRSRRDQQLHPVKTVALRPQFRRELNWPVVVLTNRLTASAAEILTGALQDHRRAQVIGMRTFGKGTILTVTKLVDGGALRYASAHYLTPKHRVIEQRGLRPDIEIGLSGATVFKIDAQSFRYPGVIAPPHGVRDVTLWRAVTELEKKLEVAAK